MYTIPTNPKYNGWTDGWISKSSGLARVVGLTLACEFNIFAPHLSCFVTIYTVCTCSHVHVWSVITISFLFLWVFSKLQFQNKQQKGNVSEWINTLSYMIILTDVHVHCTCIVESLWWYDHLYFYIMIMLRHNDMNVHVLLSDYDSMIILLWMYCWVTVIYSISYWIWRANT